jgi:hypothetical protein
MSAKTATGAKTATASKQKTVGAKPLPTSSSPPPLPPTKVVPSKFTKHLPIEKKKYIKPTHDFLAVSVVMPEEYNKNGELVQLYFGDVVEFYREQFLKEVCVNNDVLDDIYASKYIINPHTGYANNTHILKYSLIPNSNNTIHFGDRKIVMGHYLNQENFAKKVHAYYKAKGFGCEIFQSGYDKERDRYRNICIKLTF